MNMDIDLNYVIQYIKDFNLVKDNFIEVLKECFKFDGTLSRTKFFTFYFIVFCAFFACCIISSIISTVISVIIPFIGWIISFVIFFVILALFLAITVCPNARRLREAGFPPHLTWLSLVCLGIIPLVLGIFPSKNDGIQTTQPTEPQEQPPANS